MLTMRNSWMLLLAGTLLLGACKKEEDVAPDDDNEAITTATLSFTNVAAPAEVVTATIENLNTTANTTNATVRLKPNTSYRMAVLLSDKTKTPTLDVSAYLLDEANEHLFVYAPAPANLMTVTIIDRDTSPAPGPFPLGLRADVTTGAAGSGTLNVRLRHQPGVKNGTATPGSDDLNVNFPVVLQ